MYHNLFRTLLVIVMAITLAACGISAPISPPAQATKAPIATKVPVSPLVGEWQRVNSCASFVQAFKEAGLIDLAPEWLVGGGYFTSLD